MCAFNEQGSGLWVFYRAVAVEDRAMARKGLGVEALKKSIRLKFTLSSGERVSETLPWLPSPAHIKRAYRLAADVRRDIEARALDDARYLQYFPDTKRVH